MRAAVAVLVLACGGCTWLRDRGLDFADGFRLVAGGGLGLCADAQVTRWFSPGIGVASRTHNLGWYDRWIHGVFLEGDVINTPRLAYEVLGAEYSETPEEDVDHVMFAARLAYESMNLPNERWIRVGETLVVEQFALFNFGSGYRHQAAWLVETLLEHPDDLIVRPRKTVWQSSFLEVGATVGLVHARAGVNPLELFDFLAGLVGFDPAGDDGREPFYPAPRYEPPWLEQP